MRAVRILHRLSVGAAATALLAGAAGCGAGAPAASTSRSASPSPTGSGSPADTLVGLVAAAADQHYVATYRYTPPNQAPRTVTVTLAADNSWRVDVPAAGLGGGRDVSVVSNPAGVFQCGLGTAPSCTKVAEPGGAVPAGYDPKIESVFTTWLHTLGNRDAALSVVSAPVPDGGSGSCFSVQPTAASLSSPVPPGVYCLDNTGVVTGATIGIGALVLLGRPGAGPPTVTLPGPITGGAAVATSSPSPAPSKSPSASPHPTSSGAR